MAHSVVCFTLVFQFILCKKNFQTKNRTAKLNVVIFVLPSISSLN